MALILSQMKSSRLAMGEETLLQLIRHKVTVAAKIFLNLCFAGEGRTLKETGMNGIFFKCAWADLIWAESKQNLCSSFKSGLMPGPYLSKIIPKKH